ncbi:MAG: YbaK/EbsC family protein [Chloroflexi bacterium]|nr:YbaK/EbsC family protein [Chloroflexota bacterium]
MSLAGLSGVQRFQAALTAAGWPHQPQELPATTRRASDAAVAVGCEVAQIAKSLVFRGTRSDQPVLVVASGANRVDEARLGALTGEPVDKPDADYVRQVTGYAIGGVPPLGHDKPLLTFIDDDLLRFDYIWAAAGSSNAVFRLTPTELVAMTAGTVVRVRPD